MFEIEMDAVIVLLIAMNRHMGDVVRSSALFLGGAYSISRVRLVSYWLL
jgi:hypothetical protein